MAATQQVARQAWRVFLQHSRSELYDYMDSVQTSAKARWRTFDGNRDRCDAGPMELHSIDWYRRNKNWGEWLRDVHYWANQTLTGLNRRVAQLDRLYLLAVLLWRAEKESAVDETLYLALEETKDLLGCFIHGWQVTLSRMTLNEWCSFGSFDRRCQAWLYAVASRQQSRWRRQALSDVAGP